MFLSTLLSENLQHLLLETNLFACHSCAHFYGLGQAMHSFPPHRHGRGWLEVPDTAEASLKISLPSKAAVAIYRGKKWIEGASLCRSQEKLKC